MTHLDVPLRLAVHVVEEFLVVVELLVPLDGLVVAEVVADDDEGDVVAVEQRLLPVLVQQLLRPAARTQQSAA